MPIISSFYGIIIYMYFSEHNPPHFHVKYNQFEATINIHDGTITGSLPRRALSLVYDWLDLHRDELLLNWEKAQRMETLDKIEPLK